MTIQTIEQKVFVEVVGEIEQLTQATMLQMAHELKMGSERFERLVKGIARPTPKEASRLWRYWAYTTTNKKMH